MSEPRPNQAEANSAPPPPPASSLTSSSQPSASTYNAHKHSMLDRQPVKGTGESPTVAKTRPVGDSSTPPVPRRRAKSLSAHTTAWHGLSTDDEEFVGGNESGNATDRSLPPGMQLRRAQSITEHIIRQRRPSASQDVLAYVYYPGQITSPTVTKFPAGPFVPSDPALSEEFDKKVSVKEPRQPPVVAEPTIPVNTLPLMDTGMTAKTELDWVPTLERTIKAIVSIKANAVRSFDTETSGAYSATGFVVDAERGIVLSNRHVVNPSPVMAQAVFYNYEEVPLEPIYYDPVHDFGFFRFNPAKVKFTELTSIPLSPQRAKVGLEIRVVGNDAGEKLSILAGTLARLDRRAPEYGIGNYNDFNTFYLQAASGTSGGSSGSPVLDIEGHAVALNAGGATLASSSFYLPLDRVVRALHYIRNDQSVPRGTLQTEFEHQSYDELYRLGLDRQVERSMRERFPDETGMLVVRSVLPKGPADTKLRPGDILVAVNDQPVTKFTPLFEVIDNSVGEKITLTICRGPQPYVVELTVQDLHSITPHSFVEIGGGVVNPLSYQVARSYGQPVTGVYVASSGHMFGGCRVWRGNVIVSINNLPTPTLEAFVEVIRSLPDGSQVPVRHYTMSSVHKIQLGIVFIDRHWHPFKRAYRNPRSGIWDYVEYPPPPPEPPIKPFTTTLLKVDPKLTPTDKVWPSMVYIECYMPYLVDGAQHTVHYGPGLVVDAQLGLIVCDRDTVPISIGDIQITFGNSLTVPGQLLLLHPVYNFAVICYNPHLIGKTPVQSAKFAPAEEVSKVNTGDELHLVVMSTDSSPVMKKTKITKVDTVNTRECSPPRWRSVNVEAFQTEDYPACVGGVMCNAEGEVFAIWCNYTTVNKDDKDVSFMAGLPINPVRRCIERLKKIWEAPEEMDTLLGESTTTTGEMISHEAPTSLPSPVETESISQPTCALKTRMSRVDTVPFLRSLHVEFGTLSLVSARTMGLSEARVKQYQDTISHETIKVVYVLNLLSPLAPAAKLLNTGDLILELQGELVRKPNSLAVFEDEKVQLTILREGKELQLEVPTLPLPILETRRVVGWAGALIQEPYYAVHEQVKSIPSSLYVSCTLYGSPANTYNLRPGVWITEVNNEPVRTMDDFLAKLGSLREKMAQACSPPCGPAKLVPDDTHLESPGDDAVLVKPGAVTIKEDDYFVRLTTVNRSGITRILSLRVDNHYWPAWDLKENPSTVSGWQCNFNVL